MSNFLTKVVKSSESFKQSLTRIVKSVNQHLPISSIDRFSEFKVTFNSSPTSQSTCIYGITDTGDEHLLVVDANSSEQKFNELN